MAPRSTASRRPLWLPLVAAALVALSLAACDDAEDPGLTNDTSTDTSTDTGTPDPDTGDPVDTADATDTAEPGDVDADSSNDVSDTGDDVDDATDVPPDSDDATDVTDTRDGVDAEPNDTTDPTDTTNDGVDPPTPGIDCQFDGSAYNGFAVDNSPIQVVSADGEVCVRIERKLASDDPFLICKACDYEVLAAWIGHDDATRHQDDPTAFAHTPTHHNWQDSYEVTTHGVRYTLQKSYDGANDVFSHLLTGVDATDGTTVVFGPVELAPYSP